MTGVGTARRRLPSIQASWNYERMLGIGFGWAASPLLDDLRAADPQRHPAAIIRSAEFFNSHPYLAGLAVGATVRAEYDGVPGEQIRRLRTALCGPLGALGDQLFWAGVLPALVGLALIGVAAGVAVPALLGLLVGYNAIRIATVRWALHTGLREGMQVAAAIRGSVLNDAAQRVGRLAGLAIGLAVPLTAGWLLPGRGGEAGLVVALVGGLGMALERLSPRLTGLRLGLGVLVLTLAVWRVTA